MKIPTLIARLAGMFASFGGLGHKGGGYNRPTLGKVRGKSYSRKAILDGRGVRSKLARCLVSPLEGGRYRALNGTHKGGVIGRAFTTMQTNKNLAKLANK